MHKLAIFGAASAIVAVGLLNIGSAFRDPATWMPDALYYQANVLEIRGDSEREAIAKMFRGPISAELRSRDPEHTANPDWVRYNEPFYERRIAVPLAAPRSTSSRATARSWTSRWRATSRRSWRSSCSSCCDSGLPSRPASRWRHRSCPRS